MEEDIDTETTRERQKRVVRAGGDWEEYVKLFLQENLKGTEIEIVKGKEISKESELWKRLAIPLKMSRVREYEWGDVDIVATIYNFPVAVISCKTSLHGRFTETLFYSLLLRTTTKTKMVLATPDAGRGGKVWSSEWGTPETPTKDRSLAETYLDGVYVENVKEFCKSMKEDDHTVLGGIVRPLSDLLKDIIRWSEEISRLIHQTDRGFQGLDPWVD